MVLQLALLLLDVFAHNLTSEPMTTDQRQISCDDGSAPWDAAGQPNWACVRHGCTPHEAVCWEDRLDYCYDDAGRDRGICAYEHQKCDSKYTCFNLWLYCDGVYHCNTNEVVGCSSGTCTASTERSGEASLLQD